MTEDESEETAFRMDANRVDRGIDRGDSNPVYKDEDGNSSADHVDPKRLVRKPSIDDIRWFYRNDGISTTIVDKPVNDAFKHGYGLPDANEDKREFLAELEADLREAHRKARRDGFALVWFRLRDNAREWEEPRDVKNLHETKVVSIDDLSNVKPIAFEEKLSAGNIDNIEAPQTSSIATTSIEDATTLRDLVELAEDGAIEIDGNRDDRDDPKRIPRKQIDGAPTKQFDTDRLTDPDVENPDGEIPYGRSKYYDISDNGIIFSNRLDDARFEKPIGYLYSRGAEFQPLLIHPSRVLHITYRSDVDGEVSDREVWGGYEGDSVLRPIIHELRQVKKSNWSISQNLFRDSSPLHVLSYEEGTPEEHINEADRATQNINAKSSIKEPPGFEFRVEDSDSDSPIAETYDQLFNQIAAGSEFTRSVLFGTQAGTVSGSETDVKNYYNVVERLRDNRIQEDMADAVELYGSFDNPDDYEFEPALGEVDWGPLFRLSKLDQAEAMARHVQTAAQATNNYILSEEEIRSILSEEWADWIPSVDIDGVLDADDMGRLDRTNTMITKNLASGVVAEGTDVELAIDPDELEPSDDGGGNSGDEMADGNPRVGQNGGGVQQGETEDSTDPTSS